MVKDFLAELEKYKDLISPETLQNVRGNIDILSEDAKERILTQLQNSVYLKKMIEEYDSQRCAVLEEAKNYLEKLDQDYTAAYKETLKEVEAEEGVEDLQNAESVLKQL